MQPKWKVILNENAGIRKAERDWPQIGGLLTEAGFEFTVSTSEYIGHAIKLTRDAILEGYRNFIAVGGDGTLNEVANGIFNQDECDTTEITVGMIMVGTGNDWGKTFNIPTDYKEAINCILKKKTFVQDVGYVEYKKGAKNKKRYFVNIAGLGFDARVVEKVNEEKQRGKGGALSYYKNLITNLISFRSKPFSMNLDGKEVSSRLFSIGIGICKYNGNGMMQLPNAVPDDGILDITVIKRISKLDVIRSLSRLYDGTILDHPKVSGYTGKNIDFNSPHEIHLEADGETLGTSPCKFGIIEKALKVIVS